MIDIKSLQKVSQGKTVIDIQSLSVENGEIAALIGSAGSGKGTLLSILAGQIRPTMGNVHYDMLDLVADRKTITRKTGILFFEDGHYQNRSVEANLNFICKLYDLPKSRVDDVLLQVGLLDHVSVRADKLPSSLARRLAFGRIILHQPKNFLLYEPFERCDEFSISLLSQLIRVLATDGAAVLILANDATNLSTLCDKIYELDQGRIINSYCPEEEKRSDLPFKIPVRLEGRVALINPSDIYYAEVIEGRSILHTKEDRLPTQYTLAELEERLIRSGFFRAHRSYLVNLQHVKDVIPYTRNSFSLRLDDPNNSTIPLSKSAAAELKELLDY